MERRGILRMIVATVVLSLVGTGVVMAAENEPIKIGAVFAITGPASFLGEPERNTAMMIADEINADGGINGRPIELVIYDTEGDNTKAVLATRKLIQQDKVIAIIGPSRSGTTMAIIPTVQSARIPLVSCAAAVDIVRPVKKWVFKTPQTDKDCVIRIFEHMKEKGISKIAIITGTTGFGDAGRKQLKSLAPEMGIEIVADETYGPRDTDMTAQLTKIKGTNAQALVNWSIVPAQSIVPKNMKQLNMDIQLYQSHGFGNVEYVKLAGEAAEGVICPAGALLAADSSCELCRMPLNELGVLDRRRHFLWLTFYSGIYASSATLFFVHPKELALLEPDISVEVARDEFDAERTVRLTSPVFVKGVWLSVPGTHVRFTDNAFDLVPYVSRDVTVDFGDGPPIADLLGVLKVQHCNLAARPDT